MSLKIMKEEKIADFWWILYWKNSQRNFRRKKMLILIRQMCHAYLHILNIYFKSVWHKSWRNFCLNIFDAHRDYLFTHKSKKMRYYAKKALSQSDKETFFD